MTTLCAWLLCVSVVCCKSSWLHMVSKRVGLVVVFGVVLGVAVVRISVFHWLVNPSSGTSDPAIFSCLFASLWDGV